MRHLRSWVRCGRAQGWCRSASALRPLLGRSACFEVASRGCPSPCRGDIREHSSAPLSPPGALKLQFGDRFFGLRAGTRRSIQLLWALLAGRLLGGWHCAYILAGVLSSLVCVLWRSPPPPPSAPVSQPWWWGRGAPSPPGASKRFIGSSIRRSLSLVGASESHLQASLGASSGRVLGLHMLVVSLAPLATWRMVHAPPIAAPQHDIFRVPFWPRHHWAVRCASD